MEKDRKGRPLTLIDYENKWTDRLLSVGYCDKALAENSVRRFYNTCNLEFSGVFLWVESPLEAEVVNSILQKLGWLILSMIRKCANGEMDPGFDEVWALVWAQMRGKIFYQVSWKDLRKIWSSIWRQIVDQVKFYNYWGNIEKLLGGFGVPEGLGVWGKFRDVMEEEIRANRRKGSTAKILQYYYESNGQRTVRGIRSVLAREVGTQLLSEDWNGQTLQGPSLEVNFCLYECYNDFCKLEYEEPIELVKNIMENCYDWLVFRKAIVLVEKPASMKLNSEGKLHSDNGMAVEFNDGFGSWRLNGVKVTEEIVMTPREKLHANIILKEKNVEVRREIVRKLGIEKVCTDLNVNCVDKWGNYELLLLDIGDDRARPYLKMLNPSVGTYHIEGVEPSCRSVKSALAWRNGIREYKTPETLT